MTKYYTRVSRYVDGVYYAADAEHPALVDIPDRFVVNPSDTTLVKANVEDAPPEADPVVPPFAKVTRRPPVVPASKKPPMGRQPGSQEDPLRPSDVDPATE